MAFSTNKITSSDYSGHDVSGLADVVQGQAATLKARFDSLVKDVVAPKYNALVDALDGGTMADYVVEQVYVSNTEFYTKWNSGKMDYHKKVSASVATANQLGSTGLYRCASPIDLGDWAVPFTRTPVIAYSHYGNYTSLIVANGSEYPTDTTIGSVYVATFSSQSSAHNFYINVEAHGHWK